jgi:hypothetical protein
MGYLQFHSDFPLGDFHQRITSLWSVILLGILPKAFQKNASHSFGFFHFYLLTRALASLVSYEPLD